LPFNIHLGILRKYFSLHLLSPHYLNIDNQSTMKAKRDFLKAYGWDERARTGTDMTRKMAQPLAQKPVPKDATLIDLIPQEDLTSGSMSLIETIRKRKSRRKYTDDPLTLEELSFLLWSTQGVRNPDKHENLSRRTVPSAGGTHPFETYLVVNRVSGLEAGLYRYLPLEHKVFLVKRDPDLPSSVSEASRNQTFVGQGAVVFIWTVIPYRAEYRFSLVAHKMIGIDVGHVCQNLYMAAESIDAGCCAIAAYDQEKMDALLAVDGTDEFAIYAAPVGKINSERFPSP
jgi:SagB-type dehydrogenase family enzyme